MQKRRKLKMTYTYGVPIVVQQDRRGLVSVGMQVRSLAPHNGLRIQHRLRIWHIYKIIYIKLHHLAITVAKFLVWSLLDTCIVTGLFILMNFTYILLWILIHRLSFKWRDEISPLCCHFQLNTIFTHSVFQSYPDSVLLLLTSACLWLQDSLESAGS